MNAFFLTLAHAAMATVLVTMSLFALDVTDGFDWTAGLVTVAAVGATAQYVQFVLGRAR